MVRFVVVLIAPPKPDNIRDLVEPGNIRRECVLKWAQCSRFSLAKREPLTNRLAIWTHGFGELCATALGASLASLDDVLGREYGSARLTLLVRDKRLVKASVFIPADLETCVPSRNKPEVRFLHHLIHEMFLVNQGRELIGDLGGRDGLRVIANRTGLDGKIDGSKVRADGLHGLSHLVARDLRDPLLEALIDPLTTSRVERNPLPVRHVVQVTEPFALPDPAILGGLAFQLIE